MALKNGKIIQAGIVLILATGIILAGTFAWYNFTQSALNVFAGWTNPGVNIHDRYPEVNGSEKDVYVENSGQQPLYIRVRFDEYMEIAGNSIVTSAQKTNMETWHVHAYLGTPEVCTEDFHNYYTWVMGNKEESLDPSEGWTYYLPAPFSHRAKFDSTGTQQGEPMVIAYEHSLLNSAGGTTNNAVSKYGGDTTRSVILKIDEAYEKIALRLAEFYTGSEYDVDENIGPDYTKLDHLNYLYKKLSEETTVVARRTVQDAIDSFCESVELGYWDETYEVDTSGNPVTGSEKIAFVPLKRTLQSEHVITMAQWISTGTPTGEFWIIDNDGWCYWGNILLPGQSTGLLLSEVILNEETPPYGVWWYGINVKLEAVTFEDLDKFADTFQSGDPSYDAKRTITDEGWMVLNAVSGEYVFDVVTNPVSLANPFVYTFVNNKDNTYRQMVTNGSDVTYGPLFVYTGPIPVAEEALYDPKEYTVGSTFYKDIPFGANNVEFTVVDAGPVINYDPGYGSGVIEGEDGKHYIYVSYNTGQGIKYAWLSVGAAGRFLELEPGDKSSDRNVLVWTDADKLPGGTSDRFQEEDLKGRVKIGATFTADSIEWLVIGIENNIDTGTPKTLIISKDVLEKVEYGDIDTTLAEYADGIGGGSRLPDLTAADGSIEAILLTIQGAIDYFSGNTERVAFEPGGTSSDWWLEDAYVTTTGSLVGGTIFDSTTEHGLRVALWIDSDKLQTLVNSTPPATP